MLHVRRLRRGIIPATKSRLKLLSKKLDYSCEYDVKLLAYKTRFPVFFCPT